MDSSGSFYLINYMPVYCIRSTFADKWFKEFMQFEIDLHHLKPDATDGC